MRLTRSLAALFVAAPLLGSPRSARAADAAGCKDHPLVTRVPNYSLVECETPDYGEQLFASDAVQGEVTVGGKKSLLNYHLDDGAKASSQAFIERNYTAALKKVGFVPTTADGRTLKLVRGGQEVWASISGYVGNGVPEATEHYVVVIVEKGAMEQVVKATDLVQDLKTTGRAVIHVPFDSGKDSFAPGAEPLVKAMAEALKAEPKLQVWVVGHTDSQGQLDANLKLSSARAATVVKALTTTHGIPAARLAPQGVGPLSPIASNDSEPGRAQNRRVELVKR